MGQPFQHPSKLRSTKMRLLLRRQEVAHLAARRMSLRQIARVVGVSHETVRKDMDWWFRELAREELEQKFRKHAWCAWCAWCAEHKYQSMPADPATVAGYLTERALQGAAASTLRRIRTVIGDAHRDAGQTNPTTHESVRRVLRGEYDFSTLMVKAARTVFAELEAENGRAGAASTSSGSCSTSCSEAEQGVVRGGLVEQDDTWETWDL